jgi:DNA polymerase-3 subunit beta
VITVLQDQCLEALKAATRVKSPKWQPVLQNIHLLAADSLLRARCTNLEQEIEARCACGGELGAALDVCVSRSLRDYVAVLPDKAPIHISVDGTQLTVSCLRTRARFQTVPASEFPRRLAVEATGTMLPASAIYRIVTLICPAAAQDLVRPVFSGVLLRLADGMLKATAVDGFRLARLSMPVETGTAYLAVVPVMAFREIAALSDESGVTMSLSPERVACEVMGGRVVTQTIQGEFPDVGQLLARTAAPEVLMIVQRQELLQAVEKAQVMSRGVGGAVRLELSQEHGHLRVWSQAADLGDSESIMEADIVRMPKVTAATAVSGRYLIEPLRGLDVLAVELGWSDRTSPICIRPVDPDPGGKEALDYDYLYIVMPMYVGD